LEGGCNVQKTAFLGLPQVRKCSGQKKTFHGWGKIREFYFESWKIDILKKTSGKIEIIYRADLKPLKAEKKHLRSLCSH